MNAVYLYPITGRNFSGIANPYINLLTEALCKDFEVVNKDHPSDTGILDLIKYLGRINIAYFNWIEDLPEKKGGLIQSGLFILLIFIMKVLKIKVVWTLHNKESHSKKHPFVKRVLYSLMLNKSDLVLTHAIEGMDMIPLKTKKIFIPHPVNLRQIKLDAQSLKEFDIIIWGTIAGYKGIDVFLDFLKTKALIDKYRILIAGKIVESDLEEYLSALSDSYNNIALINRFLDQDNLDALILQSRIILFTYHSDSILSSGALMDSLVYRSIIIGPATGAFSDLASEGMIYVYRGFSELIELIDKVLSGIQDEKLIKMRIEKFIHHNSWEAFAQNLNHAIASEFYRNND